MTGIVNNFCFAVRCFYFAEQTEKIKTSSLKNNL